MFLLLSLLVGTSAGGLLVPEGIIHPVVSVSGLTWFIRYLCFYYYHWVGTSAGGLLVPEGIIHPVVSVSIPSGTNSPPAEVPTKSDSNKNIDI
jgi:hypothetical protein